MNILLAIFVHLLSIMKSLIALHSLGVKLVSSCAVDMVGVQWPSAQATVSSWLTWVHRREII